MIILQKVKIEKAFCRFKSTRDMQKRYEEKTKRKLKLQTEIKHFRLPLNYYGGCMAID